jgi:WD40 repeat protein
MCLTQEPYGQAYFSRYPKFQRSGKGVVLFSSKWLIVGTEAGEIRCWDLTNFRLAPYTFPATAAVFAAAFSPDDARLATGGADMMITVWDCSRLQSQ